MSLVGIITLLFISIVSFIRSVPFTLKLMWMDSKMICIHYITFLLSIIGLVSLQIHLHRFDVLFMVLLVLNYILLLRRAIPLVQSTYMLFMVRYYSYPDNPYEIEAVSGALSRIESLDLNPKTKLALSREFVPYVVEASA